MTDQRHDLTGGQGAHAVEAPATPASSSTRSIGEIVGDITQDLSTLVKQELDLAKSEMKQEVAKIGKGIGMFGGAGAFGYLALIFLGMTLMWLLDNWMPVEVAALVVTLVFAAVAAALALKGRQEMKDANPALPVTQQSLKEDAQWAQELKS